MYVRKSELLRRYAVKLVPIEQLKPSPENEEIYGPINFDTDPALQSIVDSIERLGLEEPIIVTADKYILSGHRRFVAVQHLGWKEVPVRFSKIRRDESTDYHRLLAEYNPQRVKSVAALLSAQFLKNETYVSDDDFHARHYDKAHYGRLLRTTPPKSNQFLVSRDTARKQLRLRYTGNRYR